MGAKKVKISSVKRAAHLKAKKKPLSKQQQQKLARAKSNQEKRINSAVSDNIRRRHIATKRKTVKRTAPLSPVGSDDEEDLIDNVADMLEDEYPKTLGAGRHRKRQKCSEETIAASHSLGLELKYAAQSEKEKCERKVTVNLLPIKSSEGEIITRTTQVDYIPKIKSVKTVDNIDQENADQEAYSYEDSDDDVVQDNQTTTIPAENLENKLISTADLLIARKQEIDKQKFRIGIICSGILEKPEDKMRNFNSLFELIDETTKDGQPNLLTVRKIAILSITEVFKDIIPEYRVGQVDTKMTTVRKSTLERVTYENSLLQQFKKFLQKLEKLTAAVTKRNHGRITSTAIKIAEVTVSAFCDLLLAHPYFNYIKNVAQLLVYMLNCKYSTVRQCVNQCFRTLFATDKKLDMTLFIVRRINHMIKTKSNNVHIDCITCLLALKIKNVNLDAEKEMELKQKKLEAHRQRVLNLSKKERKRRRRLAEVNKELEETRAEENKQTKHFKLTEIIKMVFNIYFRVLKNDPNSKLLSAILEGLAEFAHVINLDFFSDLIEILNRILETMDIGYREQLHCIHTIFVILSGHGEVLNIDPIRFYQHLYKILFTVHAGKNHNDFRIILKTLDEVLIRRRKKISQPRLIAFVKRLLSASMHLLHNGTLASMAIIKATFQLSTVLDALLDTDSSVGSGRYDPELDDPEYCNAQCTSLYELATLAGHYHPNVRKFAIYFMNGAPTSDGVLPPDMAKLTPIEMFDTYDSSSMAFHPPIPLPRICEPKIKNGKFIYAQDKFKCYYKNLLTKNDSKSLAKTYDFYSDARNYNKRDT